MEEKRMTGYPSIDKPQNAYYRSIPVKSIDIEQTIYELVFSTNKENMDAPALEYMGVEWNYQKLKEETDKAAGAFSKVGLNPGDVVLIGLSNCFEAVVCLLALNKLGVVSKWFDIRASEKDIEEYANISNCNYAVIFDTLIHKVQSVINSTQLKKVLVIRPVDSLSRVVQVGYEIKCRRAGNYVKIPNDERYIRFWEFVKSDRENTERECIGFDKRRPSVMIQSSGTTGKPKTIIHSDFSAVSCVSKLAYSDIPVESGKMLLDLLPPWIAYALGEAIIYPLALGTKVVLSPTFEPEEIVKYLGRFTIAFAAPFHYRYLYEHLGELSAKQKKGLAKVECFVSGGDKMSIEENERFENAFQTVLVNGYGNNEGWGCLTVNPVKNNRYGTVGIPKYQEVIIAYDNENKRELAFGEVGEICVLADTAFLEYEGKREETNAVKKIHADGKVWLHTGDLGFVDKCGYITLQGRSRRVIVRRGFKISAYTIEDKVSEHLFVKECVAVEVEDATEEHVPMVYVVLKDNIVADENTIKESIIEKCMSELKGYEIPKYIEIVKSLPYTQNGKYDFRRLETIGNDLVKSRN